MSAIGLPCVSCGERSAQWSIRYLRTALDALGEK
jgi:hypothetical protein